MTFALCSKEALGLKDRKTNSMATRMLVSMLAAQSLEVFFLSIILFYFIFSSSPQSKKFIPMMGEGLMRKESVNKCLRRQTR